MPDAKPRKPTQTDLVTELTNNLAAAEQRDQAEIADHSGDPQTAVKPRTKAAEIEASNTTKGSALPREELALAGLISVVGFTIGEMGGGRCRLYLTYQMNEFVEFADRDVVGHREIKPAEYQPLGGVIMWLRRGAEVVYTRVSSQQVQAEFLSGAITQARQTESNDQSAGADGANGNGAIGDIGAYIGGYVGAGKRRFVTSTCDVPTQSTTC